MSHKSASEPDSNEPQDAEPQEQDKAKKESFLGRLKNRFSKKKKLAVPDDIYPLW